MRKLLGVLILALPLSAALSITDGTGCGTGFGASQACAAPAAVAGEMILIGIVAGNNSNNATVTGSCGTYTKIGTSDMIFGNRHAVAWYCIAAGSITDTVTVSVSGSSGISVLPAVVRGQAASSFIDQTDLTQGSATQASCTSTYTRTGNELLIQIVEAEHAGTVTFATSGSSGTTTVGATITNGNSLIPGALAHQYVTSGTSPTIVTDIGSTVLMVCNGFSIKELASGSIRHKVTNQ